MSAELKYQLFEQELLNPLRGHKLTPAEAFVADTLLDATSALPVGIAEIVRLNRKLRNHEISERAVKQIIRSLRKDHEFPILSRKSEQRRKHDKQGNVIAAAKPAGYWWCHSEAEMVEWVTEFRKQPMDELHTLSRIVKANYPKLAGQLQLDYSWCGNQDGEEI